MGKLPESERMPHCKKCDSDISDDADKCAHCGYEPAKKGTKTRLMMLLVGFSLTMTVVGSFVGVPMMIWALYDGRKAKERKPTTYPA